MYLLDSDVIINFLNGQEGTIKQVNKIIQSGLSTSVICIAEILEGLIDSNNKQKTKSFADFLQYVDVFDVDLSVSEVYSRIRHDQRKKGELLDKFDLLIASTCIANNLVLVSGNNKHFERIGELKIKN